MVERGIVHNIEGDLITLSCREECSSCGGGCSSKQKERTLQVQNVHGYSLRQGDRVEYFVSPGKALKAGFTVLIVPLILFFVFYLMSRRLFSSLPEVISVLAGFAGVALGLASNVLLNRGRKEFPQIVRVIEPDAEKTIHVDS